MTTSAEFLEARKAFHAELLESTLTINSAGVVSNADSSNTTSKAIAKGIAERLKAETIGERIAGQTSGNQFENICAAFVRNTFLKLGHLRPGLWDVHQVTGRNRLEIARYEQYAHLVALDRAAKADAELAAAPCDCAPDSRPLSVRSAPGRCESSICTKYWRAVAAARRFSSSGWQASSHCHQQGRSWH